MKHITDQLDRIEALQEKQTERLNSIDVRLAKYNSELEFHIARFNQVEDELKPIVKKMNRLEGAGILVSFLALIVGIVASIAKWYHK